MHLFFRDAVYRGTIEIYRPLVYNENRIIDKGVYHHKENFQKSSLAGSGGCRSDGGLHLAVRLRQKSEKDPKGLCPTLTDTSLYELQYQIPDDFDDVELHYPRFYSQITEELHDVIGMGVTYKHIGWQGELYTGVTFNAATKLEYHLATTGTPTDVKINGQPFKSYVPAGSARQMQYVTQFGNDVYEISFVYGDESTDAAFLNDVTFS